MRSSRILETVVPAVAALAISLGAAQASQPEAPPAPPVEELVREALERSPAIAALRARLSSARELIRPAGALPDPVIEVAVQNISLDRWTVGEADMSMVTPEFRQGLSFPGKLRARKAAAEAGAEVAAAALDALRRRVAADVRSTYARLYAADREAELLAAGRELLDLLAETAGARYRVGQSDQEAVIKAQFEASRLDEREDDLAAERSALVAFLNGLLDRPGGAPLGDVESLPPAELPAGELESAVLGHSAEVLTRRAGLAAAERRLKAMRVDLRPELFAGGGLGYRGDLDPALVLRFGAEIPLWRGSKQEPLLRATEHEVEAAAAELREAEATARASAARLAADWRRAERQVVRYREALLPRASAAFEAARASYLAGRGDYSTVIEDFRLWLDTRVELARREADRFGTWAEIESLTGPAERAGQGGSQ